MNGQKITLIEVSPEKNSMVNILSSDYRFAFDVSKSDKPITNSPNKKCYVGGCSSQVCSGDPDVVTNCMYSEEYACYQTAKCEVQLSGECGWTKDEELKSCLSKF